jgi:hypothetical protein
MMNGLFGSSIDDPKTMGVMQLAAGLMGSPRFGQGLSNGLLGYAETVQRAKQQAAAEQMNAMRMEQMKLQMEQRRAQAEQQNRDRTAMQGAFRPLPGPTMDGGSLMPRFDAGSMLGQGASPDAVIQAMQLQTAMNPPPKERVLSEGQSVFGPDGKLLFTNPKQEKPAEQPASVKEYQFAVSQGYKGTYQQFETAMKRAGAANMSVSYGAPVAGVGPDGKPIFFQPSKDGGPPSIVSGVRPPPNSSATKDPTEFQSKAALYFKSMETATKTLEDIERTNGWRPGAMETATSNPTAQTLAQPVSRQKYTQAQRQWIDSINRVRSGANLPEMEYDRAVRTFFPTFGEGEAIRQQKAAARRQEEQAMRTAAGRAMPGSEPDQGASEPDQNDPLGIRGKR